MWYSPFTGIALSCGVNLSCDTEFECQNACPQRSAKQGSVTDRAGGKEAEQAATGGCGGGADGGRGWGLPAGPPGTPRHGQDRHSGGVCFAGVTHQPSLTPALLSCARMLSKQFVDDKLAPSTARISCCKIAISLLQADSIAGMHMLMGSHETQANARKCLHMLWR